MHKAIAQQALGPFEVKNEIDSLVQSTEKSTTNNKDKIGNEMGSEVEKV